MRHRAADRVAGRVALTVGTAPLAPSVAAVVFDLDDTLFDHTHSARTVLAELYERHHTFRRLAFESFALAHTRLLDELHAEVLAGRITVDAARLERIRRLFAVVGETVADALAVDVADRYRDAYVASWRPVRGALDLLARLRRRVRLGVVTNNVVAEQLRKMEVCGLTPHLDAAVISEEVGVAKPDPRIFEIVLERLGCDAAGAVMVGDSWSSDIVGASRAGMRTVWLNRSGAPCPDRSLISAEIRSLEPADEVATLLLGASTPDSRLPWPERTVPVSKAEFPNPEA